LAEKKTPADDGRLWTVDDLAKYLGIPRLRAYRVRCPRIKVGGLLRFVPGDIRAWAEKQKVS